MRPLAADTVSDPAAVIETQVYDCAWGMTWNIGNSTITEDGRVLKHWVNDMHSAPTLSEYDTPNFQFFCTDAYRRASRSLVSSAEAIRFMNDERAKLPPSNLAPPAPIAIQPGPLVPLGTAKITTLENDPAGRRAMLMTAPNRLSPQQAAAWLFTFARVGTKSPRTFVVMREATFDCADRSVSISRVRTWDAGFGEYPFKTEKQTWTVPRTGPLDKALARACAGTSPEQSEFPSLEAALASLSAAWRESPAP